jgi:hypothetical protein
MPLALKLACPHCDAPLVRKPGGRCPSCGADIRAHVAHERDRETRIDRVVAIVSTILVLGVSLFAGGCTVVEGVIAYAVAGGVMWFLAKRTFYETTRPNDHNA